MTRKELCCCDRKKNHLPYCPLDEVGVDFSNLSRVFKGLIKIHNLQNKPQDSKRIPKILKRLENLWLKNPDLRLWQLISNGVQGNAYYIEDEELMVKLERFYKKNR